MLKSVQDFYGNKVRLRACAICEWEDGIVMVNHQGLTAGDFWAPPGGGIEFGENVPDGLKREIMEETGLEVAVGDFLFVTEFLNKPLHAIELFFKATAQGGVLKRGDDPEMGDNQIIVETRLMTWEEINSMDKMSLHGIFKILENPKEILHVKGYFKL